jgi:hypothetical protein
VPRSCAGVHSRCLGHRDAHRDASLLAWRGVHAPVRPVGAPSTRGALGSTGRRQAVGARLSKPARAFTTAIGESCRRRGHHLPAVYDPYLLPRDQSGLVRDTVANNGVRITPSHVI